MIAGISATSSLTPRDSRSCALLASINEADAEAALSKMNGMLIVAMICDVPIAEPSLLANPTATKANGNVISSSAATAPQAANRGTDSSLNL